MIAFASFSQFAKTKPFQKYFLGRLWMLTLASASNSYKCISSQLFLENFLNGFSIAVGLSLHIKYLKITFEGVRFFH